MNKNAKVVICRAGSFIGGHLIVDLRRQGYADLRAMDIKPQYKRYFVNFQMFWIR